MLPQALEIAIQNDVELRKGVPLDLYENLGLVHADSRTPRRIEIQNHIKNLFGRICKHLPVGKKGLLYITNSLKLKSY